MDGRSCAEELSFLAGKPPALQGLPLPPLSFSAESLILDIGQVMCDNVPHCRT
jgi:hypothetical protein